MILPAVQFISDRAKLVLPECNSRMVLPVKYHLVEPCSLPGKFHYDDFPYGTVHIGSNWMKSHGQHVDDCRNGIHWPAPTCMGNV